LYSMRFKVIDFLRVGLVGPPGSPYRRGRSRRRGSATL